MAARWHSQGMEGAGDYFCTANGTTQFTIELCGELVGIEMSGLSEGPLERIRRQYGPFIRMPSGSTAWRISAQVDPNVEIERGESELESDEFGVLRFHHRSSLLERADANQFQLRHAWDDARPLENALRAITSERCMLRGGGLFHSAAVEWQGEGWLFPGVSGAGKTTLCHKAGRAAVLCDEMPAILPIDGEWRVFATPFHGDYGPTDRSDHLRLRAVVLLDGKDSSNADLVSGALAIQRLLACLVRYGKPTQATLDRAESVLAGLRESVTVARLSSRLDEPFQAILARLECLLTGKGEATPQIRA